MTLAKSILIIHLLALSVFALGYQPVVLSSEQAKAEIDLLRRSLESIHPGLYRYTPKDKIDLEFARLEALARKPINDIDLYREISLTLAAIRCDHTKAELPPALSRFRNENGTHFPFRFRIFGPRLYVVEAAEGLDLPRGSEIEEINGRKVSELIRTLSAFVSVDGFTDHVRPFKLAEDSDLMGADFDHFYPFVYGFAENIKLKFRRPGSRNTQYVDTKPITYPQWKQLRPEGAVSNFSDDGAVELKLLDQKTAYLNIETFVNYRTPVDASQVFRPIFARLRSEGVDHLILDLRQNGGGSDDVPASLTRFLLKGPAKVRRTTAVRSVKFDETLRPYLQTWNNSIFSLKADDFDENPEGLFQRKANEAELIPEPEAFGGKVTVLTSSYNASGVVMLLASLREMREMTFVGEETGGSAEGPTAGVIVFLKLPHSKITVRVPVYRSYTFVKNAIPGKGIIPDVKVAETIADLLAKRDPVLASAMKKR